MMKLAAAGVVAAHLVAFPGCEQPTVRITPPQMFTVVCSKGPPRLELPGKTAMELIGTSAVAELAAPDDDGTVAASVAVEIGDGFVSSICTVPDRGPVSRVFFLVPSG
jgi:hypothetical protein